MTNKHTYTLNLSEKESAVLDTLARDKGMSKTAVLRQALRLYQLVAQQDDQTLKIKLGDQIKLMVI